MTEAVVISRELARAYPATYAEMPSRLGRDADAQAAREEASTLQEPEPPTS